MGEAVYPGRPSPLLLPLLSPLIPQPLLLFHPITALASPLLPCLLPTQHTCHPLLELLLGLPLVSARAIHPQPTPQFPPCVLHTIDIEIPQGRACAQRRQGQDVDRRDVKRLERFEGGGDG